ncbi:hypothetical protein DFJ73DRAFT_816858 [Zopfochytrium polystomum]|nr:hypothetical protein DFJ73DRAFT_816858 [Zopfochytrium polystomum]
MAVTTPSSSSSSSSSSTTSAAATVTATTPAGAASPSTASSSSFSPPSPSPSPTPLRKALRQQTPEPSSSTGPSGADPAIAKSKAASLIAAISSPAAELRKSVSMSATTRSTAAAFVVSSTLPTYGMLPPRDRRGVPRKGNLSSTSDSEAGGSQRRSGKKKFWWIQRDSLAKRMNIGKEGSRRRRRHDNNTFADHHLVQTWDPVKLRSDPRDARPGYPLPQPPTVFSKTSRSHSYDEDDDVAASKHPHQHSIRFGDAAMTRADRRQRRYVSRWIDDETKQTLRRFEREVVSFFYGDGIAEETDSEGGSSSSYSVVSSGSDPSDFEGQAKGQDASALRSTTAIAPFSVPSLASLASMTSALTARSFGSSSSSSSSSSPSASSPSSSPMPAPLTTVQPDGWVRVSADPTTSEPQRATLNLVIVDRNIRGMIQTLCRYYGLQCASKTDRATGERYTSIWMSTALAEHVQLPSVKAANDAQVRLLLGVARKDSKTVDAAADGPASEMGMFSLEEDEEEEQNVLDEFPSFYSLPAVSFVEYYFV